MVIEGVGEDADLVLRLEPAAHLELASGHLASHGGEALDRPRDGAGEPGRPQSADREDEEAARHHSPDGGGPLLLE
jgi:hypothetical protein